MKATILSVATLLASAAALSAEPIQFDFKDPKGVNNVVFKTDAPLESINGTGTGISGMVTYDPENPSHLKGAIKLDVKSLNVPNNTMREHLHGAQWMNASQYPDITFELVEAKNIKKQGNTVTADLVGKMTIKGKTKQITVPGKITYLKDRLKERQGKEGDLLVVRSSFEIKRSDFDINAKQNEEKVADVIELSLSLAGSAPKS